jgi:hypothetical protein
MKADSKVGAKPSAEYRIPQSKIRTPTAPSRPPPPIPAQTVLEEGPEAGGTELLEIPEVSAQLIADDVERTGTELVPPGTILPDPRTAPQEYAEDRAARRVTSLSDEISRSGNRRPAEDISALDLSEIEVDASSLAPPVPQIAPLPPPLPSEELTDAHHLPPFVTKVAKRSKR